MKSILLILSVACLSACSTVAYHQRVSSAYVGCPEDQIKISNEKNAVAASWIAQCNGKTFYCGENHSFNGSTSTMNCKEGEPMPEPTATPTSTPKKGAVQY